MGGSRVDAGMAAGRETGESADLHLATVALVGATNAGKSTLFNALLSQALAPVTHKVQTTRTPLWAELTSGPHQILLVDTPGLDTFKAARGRLERALFATARREAHDADVVVSVVDATRRQIRFAPESSHAQVRILVLNKIDKLPPERLLPLARSAQEAGLDRVYMISARTGAGVSDLRDALFAVCFAAQNIAGATHRQIQPVQTGLPPSLPSGLTSSLTQCFPLGDRTRAWPRIAAELTRAEVMRHVHQEVPYKLAVEPETWKEKASRGKPHLAVHQVIVTSEPSHKRILIGAKGQTLRRIGEQARRSLARALKRDVSQVSVFLRVRCERQWFERTQFAREAELPPISPSADATRESS